jgi:hypothetical protein
MTIWLGIAGCAVLFALFGTIRHRRCTGRCAGCSGACDRFQENDHDGP